MAAAMLRFDIRLPFSSTSRSPKFLFPFSSLPSYLLILFFVSFYQLQDVGALKILMYQLAVSPSQLTFSGSLADHLVERGHTVDKLIMNYNPAVTTNGSTQLRKVWRVNPANESLYMQMVHVVSPFAKVDRSIRQSGSGFPAAVDQFCNALLDDTDLLQELKEEHYDVYLTSVFEGCGFGLFELLKIPSMLGFAAVPNMPRLFFELGIPEPPSFVSCVFFSEAFGDRLGFWVRADNLLKSTLLALYTPIYSLFAQKAYKTHHGDDFPDLAGLSNKMSYYFVNTNEVIDLSKPISAKIKYIGGIMMKPPKALPKELDTMLASAKSGVILFSFGSFVKTSQIPHSVMLELFKAFAQFPDYLVVWKFDDDIVGGAYEQLFTNAPNIHPMKWIPQLDLLSDGRISVFITHVGMNSYLETTHAGVPIIAIPIFADQYYNAGAAERLGVGTRLDKTQLTADVVANALHTILDLNPDGSPSTYVQRAKEVSRMLKRRPGDPKQVFVEHVEYAAEFPSLGPDVLQLASAGMPLWKYHCLDVLAAWSAMLLAVLAGIFLFFRYALPAAWQKLIGVATSTLRLDEKVKMG